MMKVKVVLLTSLLTIGAGMTFATTTTDQLKITSALGTGTFTDNIVGCVPTGTGCGGLSGDLNNAAGTLLVTGSIAGWTINVTSGVTNSPGLTPVGLDLTVQATCTSCTAGLDIQFSDQNYNVPVGINGFLTTYHANDTGTGTTGSTSESAFFSNTNNNFAETTLIGTVGPFGGAGGSGSAIGGPIAAIPPYSLTLDQTFTANIGEFFSTDGNVTGQVPEPGAVVLFGTVLALCASKLRRRRVS
jgi:hypothetical protein